MSIYICPFVYLMHINTQVRARTHTRTSWVPLWTLIPKPSDCQLHLPLLMLFQPSRLIQGHEHQGSLFLWCARVCVGVFRHAYVCLSVHLCVCVRACMSMSSLLTNPSHPSDTVTLSTLCFLSPSDWLPPWREPRTHQIMPLFHWETVWFIYFSLVPRSQGTHSCNIHI